MGWEFSRIAPHKLLEVFSISIFSHHINDISDAEIEGSVQVTDIGNSMDLFNSKEDTGEDSILPDGTLRLTGPTRCIAATFGLVELSLKDKRHNLNLCHGSFHMNPYYEPVPYDERVSSLVTGQHGYAVVHFMLFSTAVEAIVEVSLDQGDDLISRPPSLYGSICACNDLRAYRCAYDTKYFQSTLFHATKENPKEPGGFDVLKSIPLSRNMVAVPMNSNLIIKTQLFDAATEANIVNDTSYFVAETSGSASKKIGGFMIKVNWLVDPFGTPGTVRPCTKDVSHLSLKRTKCSHIEIRKNKP